MIFLNESGAKTKFTAWEGVPRVESARRPKAPRSLADDDHGLRHALGRLDRLHDHQGATDPDVFRADVRRVLCPALGQVDVVIMDNLFRTGASPLSG